MFYSVDFIPYSLNSYKTSSWNPVSDRNDGFCLVWSSLSLILSLQLHNHRTLQLISNIPEQTCCKSNMSSGQVLSSLQAEVSAWIELLACSCMWVRVQEELRPQALSACIKSRKVSAVSSACQCVSTAGRWSGRIRRWGTTLDPKSWVLSCRFLPIDGI